ncbi:hypothetical protein C8T65DRAFT_587904, partial [Cerioporus squamosus]
ALFCYDYCLTFAQEVRHIWLLRLSVPSLLFFAVRYPALVNTVFIILDQTCWKGMTDTVLFSALRAYALCGRNPWTLALVLLLGLVNPAISLVSHCAQRSPSTLTGS